MGRFLVIFSLLFALAGAATAASPLSSRAFTDAAAAAASAAMPSAKVTITGDLQLETRSAAGNTTTTDLTNAYQLYLVAPSHRDEVIHKYVGALVETVHDGDIKRPLDRSRVVAVMKSRVWLDAVRKGTSVQAPQLLADPYNAELAIVYAEDRPTSKRFLTTRDDVGDRAKLRDLALGNLRNLITKVTIRGGADSLWLFEAGGEYEASLLLVDRLWTSGQIKVDGEIVVAVPAKDALIATGSHNHAGLARLQALAIEFARGPYSLTADLLIYHEGKFVQFDGK